MREMTVEKDGKLVATVREVICGKFDREFSPAEVNFSEFADEGDCERITRTIETKHFKNERGKAFQVVPGTVWHFELLPGIFIRMGYQVRTSGNIEPYAREQ
jgi:hypothetical protein